MLIEMIMFLQSSSSLSLSQLPASFSFVGIFKNCCQTHNFVECKHIHANEGGLRVEKWNLLRRRLMVYDDEPSSLHLTAQFPGPPFGVAYTYSPWR